MFHSLSSNGSIYFKLLFKNTRIQDCGCKQKWQICFSPQEVLLRPVRNKDCGKILGIILSSIS